MAWPFLTDILRRKLWCSGPSAPVPQRRVIEVSQDQRLLTLSLPLYPLSLTRSLTHFSMELTLGSTCTCRLPCCPSRYLPCIFLLPSLSPYYNLSLFFRHFHQLPLIPFLSTHHITYFPHLLVTVLNVNHLPNNCRYPPDMQESQQRENPTPGSINHHSDNQANCRSNGF